MAFLGKLFFAAICFMQCLIFLWVFTPSGFIGAIYMRHSSLHSNWNSHRYCISSVGDCSWQTHTWTYKLWLLGYSNGGVASSFPGRSICYSKSAGGLCWFCILLAYSQGDACLSSLEFIIISGEIIVIPNPFQYLTSNSLFFLYCIFFCNLA